MLDILIFGLVMLVGLIIVIGLIAIVLLTSMLEHYRRIVEDIRERRRYRLYR